MSRLMVLFVIALAATACTGPMDTPVPKELAGMDSLQPALKKLSPEDRELFAGYVMRNTLGAKLGAMFGGKEGPGIPHGMTVGRAIEDQRKFKAERALEEAREAALKDKLRAEREVAIKTMRESVTITIVSKEVKEERVSGMLFGENLQVVFGYRNNSAKDISGVKGRISVKDLFGDEISAFAISNDQTIKAGDSATWTGSRSVRLSMGNNQDRKFAGLGDDKYKVIWEPEIIVFSDGAKLIAPSE